MILGIEVLLTVYGCVMLFRAKGMGKDAVTHPHYRFLGVFLLTLLPVAFAIVLVFGIIWAMNHPGQTGTDLEESMRWPAMGVEAVVAITYATICHFWDKSIKARAEREATESTTF